MSNAGGWGGDALIAGGYGVATARKIVNTAGFTGAMVTLMLMPSARSVVQVRPYNFYRLYIDMHPAMQLCPLI